MGVGGLRRYVYGLEAPSQYRKQRIYSARKLWMNSWARKRGRVAFTGGGYNALWYMWEARPGSSYMPRVCKIDRSYSWRCN